MNVLILTGAFGLGHISAAEAIRAEIVAQDSQAVVTVADVLETCTPNLRKVIYHWFDFTVNRCAGVYNLLNRVAAQFSCAPMQRAMLQKLEFLLLRHRPDLVISTLPLSSQYLSAYKRFTGSTLPLYTYITDINAHSEWITPETDCYFVGGAETWRSLLGHGIPASRIVVSGIPVRQEFCHSGQRTFPAGPAAHILVMGGGLGLIPRADKLWGDLAAAPGVKVTVITGRNTALRRELVLRYPEFHVVGLTDQVSDYMGQADLLLTKAGGITTFEAIHTATPLYLLRPFLMQEVDNALFIARQGFGKVSPTRSIHAEDVISLARNRKELASIRQRMTAAVRRLDHVTALDRYHEETKEAAC